MTPITTFPIATTPISGPAIKETPTIDDTIVGVDNTTGAVRRFRVIQLPYIYLPSQGWRLLRQGRADPRYFGAAVDGSTDDTTAYQTASNELAGMALAGMFLQNSSGTWQSGLAAPGAGTILIPAGVSIISQLILGHRVSLEGVGFGSVIRQKAATSGHAILNRWDGTAHAKGCRLANFLLDGNKANQSVANHGIYLFGSNNNTYNDPLDEDYDSYCRVVDVFVIRTKGTGVYTEGAGAHTITRLKTRNCDAYGCRLSQDNHLSEGDLGWSGLAGLRIDGDSCRISTTKAWFSGQVSTSPGFHITADSGVMGTCSAQDNKGQGFLFDGAYGWACAALEADSNDTAAGTYAGFDIYNSANCNIQGIARNRYAASGATGTQDLAVKVSGGATNNDINITAGMTTTNWGTTTALSADTTHRTNNRIRVNSATPAT